MINWGLQIHIHSSLCSLRTIGLSPLFLDSAGCPQCGVNLAQKFRAGLSSHADPKLAGSFAPS